MPGRSKHLGRIVSFRHKYELLLAVVSHWFRSTANSVCHASILISDLFNSMLLINVSVRCLSSISPLNITVSGLIIVTCMANHIIFKVFPSTTCPYRGVKVTCFGKSLKVFTRESFLHLPLNLCKIMHIMPLVN